MGGIAPTRFEVSLDAPIAKFIVAFRQAVSPPVHGDVVVLPAWFSTSRSDWMNVPEPEQASYTLRYGSIISTSNLTTQRGALNSVREGYRRLQIGR